MLQFLTEKRWLGEQHLASEYICNVLTEPFEIIKDKKFAEQILSAEETGRHAASMHLCCKVWDVFGDLTDEERLKYFNNKSMESLRGHWKKNIGSFSSMADHLKISASAMHVGFKKKQKASTIIDVMHKRYRTVVSSRDNIDKIIHADNESEFRKNAAKQMRKELEDNSHLHCSRAFAFRKDLEQDEPFRESRRDISVFYENLQTELRRAGALDCSIPFIETEPRSVESNISSVHIDITEDVKKFRPTQTMGMETMDVGGAVFAKVSRRIHPFVTSERYKDLVDLHIHVDVLKLKPAQVSCERRAYHDFDGVSRPHGDSIIEIVSPNQSTAVDPAQVQQNQDMRHPEDIAQQPFQPQSQRGNAEVQMLLTAGCTIRDSLAVKREAETGNDEEVGNTDTCTRERCETNTILAENWGSLMSVPGNLQFLTYLHAVFAAKAAVQLLESKSGRCSNIDDEKEKRDEIQCSVFLHGTAISISQTARKTALHKLQFPRRGEAVMITGTGESSVRAREGVALEIKEDGVDAYDVSCCWRVSPKGFERYSIGDSEHGTSQTRFVRAVDTVTRNSFTLQQLPQYRWKVLVVSESEESPLVTLISSALHEIKLFHKVNESIVDISLLQNALQRAKIVPEDLVLLHALAGNTVCPSTRHVSQKKYLEAYFCWIHNVPSDHRILNERDLLMSPTSAVGKEEYLEGL